jgi:hypothetical protein
MRRLFAAAAAGVALAGCASPGAPDRAIPKKVKNPTFLSVTNAPAAPMLVGSVGGSFISRDAGRRWTQTFPRMRDTLAVAYSLADTLVSRGRRWVTWDLGLTRLQHSGIWPFHGNVTAMADDAAHRRIWAISQMPGHPPQLWFSKNGHRQWDQYPAVFLCPHPRSIAAIAGPQRRDHVRIFVACGDGGLQVSDDLGWTFQKVPVGAGSVLDVATSETSPTRVVIVTPDLKVSSDGGLTWRGTSLSAERVAVDPRNANLIFAIAQNGRLYVSTNGGKSF